MRTNRVSGHAGSVVGTPKATKYCMSISAVNLSRFRRARYANWFSNGIIVPDVSKTQRDPSLAAAIDLTLKFQSGSPSGPNT